MDWGDIGQAVLVAIVIAIVNYFFAKRIEKGRTKTDKEIEELKTYLGTQAFEDQLVIGRVYERRAQIIDELYGYIVRTEAALREYVNPLSYSSADPSDKDAQDRAYKEERDRRGLELSDWAKKFFDFELEKRIYFDKGLIEKLSRYQETIKAAVLQWNRGEHVEARKKALEEALDLRTEIQSRFRELLGVIEGKQPLTTTQ